VCSATNCSNSPGLESSTYAANFVIESLNIRKGVPHLTGGSNTGLYVPRITTTTANHPNSRQAGNHRHHANISADCLNQINYKNFELDFLFRFGQATGTDVHLRSQFRSVLEPACLTGTRRYRAAVHHRTGWPRLRLSAASHRSDALVT
jgi:hypothetical protein